MNRMRISIYAVILMSLIFTMSSCSSHEAPAEAAEMPSIKVATQVISSSSGNNRFMASGNIQPSKEANISTRMMGYIDRITVKMGDKVAEGQLLVSISNNDIQAKLAQVKANILKAEVAVGNAKKDFDRITNLKEKNSVTQKELDDITAHYNMAKAGLEAAKQMKAEVEAQSKYTSIKAPFSGIVTSKYVNVGDMANPGMPLLTIATKGNYEAVAFVPENRISELKKGQQVMVTIKSLGAEIPATITEIAVSSQHTGGQYIVKSKLGKHTANLYAGMFTTVSFEGDESTASKSLFIPASSLVQKGSLKGVYTMTDANQAILRWLRVGDLQNGQYEVFSGLSDGETIITQANSKLYNGAPVTL